MDAAEQRGCVFNMMSSACVDWLKRHYMRRTLQSHICGDWVVAGHVSPAVQCNYHDIVT